MVNQLPQGWKEEELGKLADVIAGQSPEGIYYNTVGDGTPFYQGKSEFQEMYLGKPTKWTTKVTKLAKRNDILMSVRAPVGPVNITQEDICIGRGLAAITAKSMLLQLYLFYHLKYLEDKISGTNGAVFASISKREIEQIKITYPIDKEEQDYIVKTLDAVAEIIRLRKETIQLAKDLIPTIFHEMFGDPITNPKGWDKKNLGQVCDVRSGNAFPERYQGYTDGKPFYKVGDISRTIEENHIYLDKAKNYITDEIAQIIKAKSFSKNTIVFAKVGEALRLNRRALISKDAFIDNNVMGVSIKEDCNDLHYLYLYYHFVCNVNLNFIKKEGAIPSVNNKDINNLYLPIPPLSLQKDFAKKVEQINDYIIAQQEELEQFEILFQSLLHEAFTGVLTWNYPRKECHDKKDK